MLDKFGLLVDVRGRRLIDPNTGTSLKGFLKKLAHISVNVACSDGVDELLREFPEVTGKKSPNGINFPEVFHHIITTGPPVSERVRRLTPDKYQAVKKEFEMLVEEGVCRHLSSP